VAVMINRWRGTARWRAVMPGGTHHKWVTAGGRGGRLWVESGGGHVERGAWVGARAGVHGQARRWLGATSTDEIRAETQRTWRRLGNRGAR
jgi:hypothetical protein